MHLGPTYLLMITTYVQFLLLSDMKFLDACLQSAYFHGSSSDIHIVLWDGMPILRYYVYAVKGGRAESLVSAKACLKVGEGKAWAAGKMDHWHDLALWGQEFSLFLIFTFNSDI